MEPTTEALLLLAGTVGLFAVFWFCLRNVGVGKTGPSVQEHGADQSEQCDVESSSAVLGFDEMIVALDPKPRARSLVIFCGAPGSGKSRIADALAARGYVCVSLDKIWEEMPHARIYPDQLEREYERQLALAFASGANVVDDNLNYTKERRRQIIERARKAGYVDVLIVHMDTPLDVCQKRNPERKYAVPAWRLEEIWRQFNASGLPSPCESKLVRIQPRDHELKHCQFFG